MVSDHCSLLPPYFIKEKGGGGLEEPCLRGSYGAHSTLDLLCRHLCSFSTAAFVLGAEEHSPLLLLQRAPLPRRGGAAAPWEPVLLSSLSQRKAGDGFRVVSVREFM